MTRLIFDIEANGFLETVTKIHCIAAIDIDTGAKYVYGPKELSEGVAALNRADLLVAHGGIRYDYPVLRKLCDFKPSGILWDTVTLSRLIRSNLKERDFTSRVKLPGRLMGSHSIEAWGIRLGVPKMVFDGPWAEWTQAMQDYCVGDVETLRAIWQHLDPDNYSRKAIDLEHRVAHICHLMETSGWPFDEEAAGRLHVTLLEEKTILEKELKEEFGSWYESAGEFVPKADNKRFGYLKGMPITKIKTVDFNPASRQHIYKQLIKLGWKPKSYTDSGQPKVDEAVLDAISKDYPQAAKLSRLLMLNKRIGQLATGDNAWLKLVGKDGSIHGGYNTNGCVTGRASHIAPNIAQVPKVGKPFGAECRSCFVVRPSFRMVGSDQAGLEQRTLAHYTWAYDKGEYATKSLESEDIHWMHAQAIGIAKGDEEGEHRKVLRDYTKTWFYAFVYGAGNGKLTSILRDLGHSLRKVGIDYTGVKDGPQSRKNFGERIPALGSLSTQVSSKASAQKAIKGLDGRIIPCEYPHKALNYACQSAGAILCKEWLCSTYEALIKEGLRYGWDGDFTFLGWVHDELQIAVRNKGDTIEKVKDCIRACGERAGEPYNFRVPLAVESKEGQNWCETH